MTTIRDIAVAFGFDVDKASQAQAENSIKGLKNMATKLLGKIAVAFSVAKLVSFAKDCVEAASNVEEMENKFNTVFDHLSDEVDQWAEDFANSVGRNKNTIKSYLADQQNLLVGFGMTREEGAKLSEEMTTLALDIASFANQNEDVAVNAMTKAVMGESEAAKTLGAVLNDVTRAETMQALGMKGTYQSLSQLEKMQVNYQTILKQSPDAVGDCIRSMGSFESSMRQLKAAQEEFKEFVGGQLLPVMSVFVQWTTKGVKAATAFAKAILLDAEGNNRILLAFERVHAIVKRLQPAIDRFTSSMSNGINKAKDTVKNIVDKMGGMENAMKLLTIVAGAFILAMNWDKIIGGAKTFLSLIGGIGKLFSFANLKVLAVVSAIVILALIVEDFINFLLGNDSVIGTIFDNAGIGADNARQKILEAWDTVTGFLTDTWNWIKTTAEEIFSAVKKAISGHMDSISKSVSEIWSGIETTLSVIWENISGLAEIVFGGLFSFFDGWELDLEGIFEALVSAVDDVLQVFGDVGDWISEHKAAMDVLVTVLGSIAAAFGIVQAAIAAYNIISGICATVSAVMAGGFSLASAAGGVLAGVIAFITSPVTIAVAAIAALIAIGVLLYKNWDTIKEYAANIWNAVVASFSNMVSGITGFVGNIKDSIVNGFTAAIDWIKGLPGQALQWGADIIGGIVDGINGAIGKIGDAAKGVANKIKSFLHFSVPDEGPLTDFQSWMPDFMSGLAQGIGDSEDTLLNKVKGVANGIKTLMQGATASAATAASSQINNTTSSMTQNVNINNSYSGGSAETQKNVSKAMNKSAVDATTQMARGLAYARG